MLMLKDMPTHGRLLATTPSHHGVDSVLQAPARLDSWQATYECRQADAAASGWRKGLVLSIYRLQYVSNVAVSHVRVLASKNSNRTHHPCPSHGAQQQPRTCVWHTATATLRRG